MPIVFVIQSQMRFDHILGRLVPKFDVTPAQKHGKLSYLLSPSAAPFSPNSVIAELTHKLARYNPDVDSLLLIGNPCLIGFAVAIAADRSEDGHLRLLQWSGKDRAYALVETKLYPFALEERAPILQ